MTINGLDKGDLHFLEPAKETDQLLGANGALTETDIRTGLKLMFDNSSNL